jgi:hypothetical protein
MENTILAPASVLVLWSLIMLIWAAATRFPAIAKSGIDMKNAKPGGRGQDLDGVVPDQVQWKSHNYAHLMEQPTIFYATVAILALAGQGGGINTNLAWGYTVFRIAHSIWQATVNTIIPVRFGLFLASTICLIIMAINAVIATF